MHKLSSTAVAVATAFGLAPPALAQSSGDIREIREQIEQMKQEYEARIKALEQRLQAAESKAGAAEQQATQAQQQATQAQQQATQAQQQASSAQGAATATAQQERANTFNPAIALVLQGRYANLSQNPDTYRIGGFIPTESDVGPGPRGFSVSESELNISASVDHYFSGYFTAAYDPDGGVDVENAYLQTSALGHGFTLTAGRYFSGIGYLNQQHQHAWDFIYAPLPYQAFLGGQLGDDGVQVKWVAPTDLFVELGAEFGRGRTFPGSDPDKNGFAMNTVFAHVGGDLGVSNSWKAGLSYLETSPSDRTYLDGDGAGSLVYNTFSGKAKLYIADFVWKWAPDGNPTSRNFKFQTEYFWFDENGTLTYDASGAPIPGAFSSNQSGWYAQAVYQFMPEWRVGVQYNQLNYGTVNIGQVQTGVLSPGNFPILEPYNPTLTTAMIDWSPSEFSRIRLQYAQNKARPGGETDNQWFLQYILTLGAHGAHIW